MSCITHYATVQPKSYNVTVITSPEEYILNLFKFIYINKTLVSNGFMYLWQLFIQFRACDL